MLNYGKSGQLINVSEIEIWPYNQVHKLGYVMEN